MDLTQTQVHPASDSKVIELPDFLLAPIIEAAVAFIKKNEESAIPSNLRRISNFDAIILSDHSARAQILQSILTNTDFREHIEDELFQRAEVNIAFEQWNSLRAQEIIEEAATRNDLPLLASILWLKKPENYEYALGLIVAYSSIAIQENELRDSKIADETRYSHLEDSLDREKNKIELLQADVARLEQELRVERQSHRVKDQKSEVQIRNLEKKIGEHDEVVKVMKDQKTRIQERFDREASRASELESRLKLAHEESKAKTDKIANLQEQLANSLSSDIDLTYEDLQNLMLAQQNSQSVSDTILSIMNKTRKILTNDPVNEKSTPQQQANKEMLSVENLVLLIDGNSVSRNAYPSLGQEKQRENIIANTQMIESKYHHSCVVIFDGQSSSTHGRVQSKVHILFAPTGMSAADVIVERIRMTVKSPIMVITENGELSKTVMQMGCKTLDSKAFLEISSSL